LVEHFYQRVAMVGVRLIFSHLREALELSFDRDRGLLRIGSQRFDGMLAHRIGGCFRRSIDAVEGADVDNAALGSDDERREGSRNALRAVHVDGHYRIKLFHFRIEDRGIRQNASVVHDPIEPAPRVVDSHHRGIDILSFVTSSRTGCTFLIALSACRSESFRAAA
jgi:hypothetical protein